MRVLNPKFKLLRIGLLKNLGLVFICLWSFFIMLGYMIPLLSIATYATLGVGLSQAQGAAIQASFAAGQLGGFLVFWADFYYYLTFRSSWETGSRTDFGCMGYVQILMAIL
jgi:hypothetical protein